MKTGRNDPCPCQSGKKYKKCCGVHVPLPVVIGTGDACGSAEIVDYDEDMKRAQQNVADYTADLAKRGVVLPV